jgi:hypothetical protein
VGYKNSKNNLFDGHSVLDRLFNTVMDKFEIRNSKFEIPARGELVDMLDAPADSSAQTRQVPDLFYGFNSCGY